MSPDQTPHPATNDIQPLPPSAPGIPGVNSDPIELTDDMKHDLADAAPSEGTGVTGCLRDDECSESPPAKQSGGSA